MVMMRAKCPDCNGDGNLAPLGDAGDPLDVKRFFPRPCDACNCMGFIYTETEIEENKNDGYVAGQGDR